MKVTVENISPIKKKLMIEVLPEEFLEKLEEAFQKLQKKVSIKGFRKGKAPRALLEQRYKAQTEMDVFSDLLEESYKWALQDQQITPLAPPTIRDVKREDSKPITYTAEVEVRPQVTVSKYKKIPLQKLPVEPSDEEVEKELLALRESHAQISPVAEGLAVQSNHIVVVDFIGRIDDQPFEGGTAQGVMVELGRGQYLKDLEEGILGMKKGETKTFPVHFPADYVSFKLAGKEAQFEVTVQDIKERILPEANDDFARDLGDFTSLDQIKEKLREGISKRKEGQNRGALYDQLMNHLIQEHPFEVPDAMIERELYAMFENFKNRLQQQKLTLEQSGHTEESFRSKSRELALRRVKAFLLFEAIAQMEKIEVKPEEMKERLSAIAQSIKQNVELVEKYYRENRLLMPLALEILEGKVLDFLITEANVQ